MNISKEAMRKLLEDCWDDGYGNGMMLGGKARKKAKDTYITSKLSAMEQGGVDLEKLQIEINELLASETDEKLHHWIKSHGYSKSPSDDPHHIH